MNEHTMPESFGPATIDAAEQVAGVSYTGAERALMADNLALEIGRAKARRAVRLPRDLPPATRFDPRLPGWAPPPGGAFRLLPEPSPDLPADEADIAFAPVSSLAGWIMTGALSAERLTNIYLDRIARYAPALECIVTVTDDLALSQARRADALLAAGTYLGPLHGIPWGCKDILDTQGIVTGWGAEPWADRVPQADAAVVRRLHDAGAVMLGKTSVGALAYGDIWYGGVTRNPWNVREGSSGSSAGSASAVAAGLVGFALGTETLGSIVCPSLRCGTTGLRPTFGRVSRIGAMPLCWTLDKIGPIARGVADTALILRAINGADPADPCSIAAPLSYDPALPVQGMRVGYYPADFADADALDLDRAMLDLLRRLGVSLVELQRPDLPYDSLLNTLSAEAAASFEELTLSDEDDRLTWQDADAWPNEFRKARFLSAVDHIQLDRLRRRVMQDMDGVFREVDAIIGPCMAGPMLVITNFTGHPSLVLRCGFRQSPTRQRLTLASLSADQHTADDARSDAARSYEVPHAISLYGRLFDEGTLLRLGTAMETRLKVAERRPPMPL